jgi:hypothetical protein
MNKYLIGSALLILLSLPISATNFAQEQTRDDPTEEKLRQFNRDANNADPDLLFKALTYTAPDPNVYYSLRVYQDGRVSSWRVVINWAVQNSHSAKLNSEQVEIIKEKLGHIKQSPAPADVEAGHKYTAFLYLNDAKYTRCDFADWPITDEAGEIIDLVESELRAQGMR